MSSVLLIKKQLFNYIHDYTFENKNTNSPYLSNSSTKLAWNIRNKIVGSLKNVVSSVQMETRLKKWRSGMEAVISNLKRGFHLFRCEWKGRDHFDAKVLWSVIAYNIRVMTGFMLGKLMPQPQ